ncbi:MAG: hypothetical protein J6J42_07305 [Lachnospiraceae bacterium]|nr:hypothetical protein [Lachnospiraceae bacterium]
MKKITISLLFLTLCLFSGCSQKPSEHLLSEQSTISTTPLATTAPTNIPTPSTTVTPTSPPSPTPTVTPTNTPAPIQVFLPEEVAVVPKVVFYDFEEVSENNIYHQIYGLLPGLAFGNWYTVRINGVEYYYALADHRQTEPAYFYGYSLIDENYSLANGISVGMTVEEILDLYPNVAIVNFDNEFIGEKVWRFAGWNGIAYPYSPIDFDPNYKYNNQDYDWTNQFDYIIAADIQRPADTLPIHLGLLIKDNKIAAITFYYPTAG